MLSLRERIKRLEEEEERELSYNYNIFDRIKTKVITGESMVDLYSQCSQQNLEMITMPDLAERRIHLENGGSLRFLWKYNWLTSSALSRITHKGQDYGVFTHVNPFGTEEKRIQRYRNVVHGAAKIEDEDIEYILSMKDDKNVIIVPYQQISNAPRGVISLKDIKLGNNIVASGSFGNDEQLLDDYIETYTKVMAINLFNPNEMGVWFSEDAKENTMRPLELGGPGIGIYNRNLTNKKYRTIGLHKP